MTAVDHPGVGSFATGSAPDGVRAATGAHFQIYATAPGEPVGWRLLSGNNRDLGRGTGSYPNFASCLVALRELLARLDRLEPMIRPGRPNRWQWGLREHGEVLVISGHHYDRMVRCEQARDAFVQLAAGAALPVSLTVTASRRTAQRRGFSEPLRARPVADTRRLGPVGGLRSDRLPALGHSGRTRPVEQPNVGRG